MIQKYIAKFEVEIIIVKFEKDDKCSRVDHSIQVQLFKSESNGTFELLFDQKLKMT